MNYKIGNFISICIFLLLSGIGYADDFTIEKAGDYLNLLLPSYALGMTMKENDYTGTKQFAFSYGGALATQLLLKELIDEERPNKADYRSFPSGHAQSAFSSAMFIHKRYGLKRAIAPYLLAIFVGYSRVESDWHYPHDVLAGAAIAGLFTWFFVDKENSVILYCDTAGIKLNINFKF
jgi:membrane-associated phospholipid phosphatase